MDPINVSRSGRIRKKSSKLADFESSDEIENHGGGAAGGSGSATPTMRRPRSANSSLDSIGALNQPKSSYMVDSIPPHQLLAEEEVKREEDEFKTEEEEYEDEDDFDMEAVEDIKEEDFDAIPFVGVDDDDDEEDDVANRVQAQVVYKEEGEEAEVDVENDGDDEGDERNLMIDERKRQPKKSLYFSEKTAKTKRNADGEGMKRQQLKRPRYDNPGGGEEEAATLKPKKSKTDQKLYGETLDAMYDSLPRAHQQLGVWLFRKVKNLFDPLARDLRMQYRQIQADLAQLHATNQATKDFAQVAAAEKSVETESTRLKAICLCPWTSYENMVDVCESDEKRSAAVKYIAMTVNTSSSANIVTEVCNELVDPHLASILYVSDRNARQKSIYILGRKMNFLPYQFIPMVRNIVQDASKSANHLVRNHFSVQKITKWLENKRVRYNNRLYAEYRQLGEAGDKYAELLANEYESKSSIVHREVPHPQVASRSIKTEVVNLFYYEALHKWSKYMSEKKQKTAERTLAAASLTSPNVNY